MSTIIRRPSFWLAAALGAGLACGGDDCGADPKCTTLSARITVHDTTVLTGETTNFFVTVQYVFGPGTPLNVFWSLSDTTALSLGILSDGSALVSAKKPGSGKLIAFINKTFTDTATIVAVAPGTVLWRQSLAGAVRLNAPALDDSGNVYVLNAGSGTATLAAFTPAGASRYAVGSCAAALAPGVDLIGNAFTTGAGCTKRLGVTGATSWTATIGTVDGGVALAANAEVVLLHSVGTTGAGAVALSRLGTDGVEKWRDTLFADAIAQASAPSIAQNGDIYVAWEGPAASYSVSRVTQAGTVRWTVPTTSAARFTTPAVVPNRILVAQAGGLVAFDTTGLVVWSRVFHDANPGASLTEQPSSPVIDDAGIIYVQTPGALYSYDGAGTLRWFADSLGAGSGATSATGVGGPSILIALSLVVPCKGEVCVAATTDGSLKWRSALGGGVVGSLGVGPEGLIYAVRNTGTGAELVALRSRPIVLQAGWPTEGHDMQRSRRQF
jgi:hypothetical protein